MKTATRTSSTDSHIFTKYVGLIKTKPRTEQSISLGNFDASHPPKGFSIDLETPVSTAKNVSADIVTSGSTRHYELMLRVTNNTGRTVSAEVWSM
jgi:hypothetical protein